MILRLPTSKNSGIGCRRVVEEPISSVEGEMSLSDGDEFRIGPAILVFCAPGEGSTRTRR
jgi:hypothetical protein